MKNTYLVEVSQAQSKVQESDKKNFNPTSVSTFIRIEKKDVTLKFVFDNIRNIGIAALIAVIGYSVAWGDPIKIAGFIVPYLKYVTGWGLIFFAFVLVTLNFIQSIMAYLVFFKKEGEKSEYVYYFIFYLITYFGVVTIFTAQVYKFSGG